MHNPCRLRDPIVKNGSDPAMEQGGGGGQRAGLGTAH